MPRRRASHVCLMPFEPRTVSQAPAPLWPVKLTFDGSYSRSVSCGGESDDNDVELPSVRAGLEMLVRARALGGWTHSDEERYRVLCERERELLRDDESGHSGDA
jgi:hypothetical protein